MRWVDRDRRYKRAVAICTVSGVDLAEWLVENGLALDWLQYSKGYNSRKHNTPTSEFGAAVSKNLGGIGLVEERADHPLAVPINHSNVRFASHCRRNADIDKSENLHINGSDKPYSITSSARPIKGSGISNPSALAVFRLMYSSTLVTCWTGRLAGFSPRRIRPV